MLHYSRGNSTNRPRRAYVTNFRPKAMIDYERRNKYDHGKDQVRCYFLNIFQMFTRKLQQIFLSILFYFREAVISRHELLLRVFKNKSSFWLFTVHSSFPIFSLNHTKTSDMIAILNKSLNASGLEGNTFLIWWFTLH